MNKIGFSTGSLSLGNFSEALEMLKDKNVSAVELSALRENELPELMDAIQWLDLSEYQFVSIHAPSKLIGMDENALLIELQPAIEKGWHIVVHPDIIKNDAQWQQLGSLLCIENMDKRKPVGRTARDMQALFERFPEASFCFDIAHAKQVDPTMLEAVQMLRRFSDRLVQIHMSEVNTHSRHERLNLNAIMSYQMVSELIPYDTPVILESPVSRDEINSEIQYARMALSLDVMQEYFAARTIQKSTVDFILNQQKEQVVSMQC